jgi:2,4'-dihydroxyacetophenone dioxygenase
MSQLASSLAGTLHIVSDDLPWVGHLGKRSSGVETRVLHVRPEDGLIVTQVRAQPYVEGRPHRHLGPAFAFTTSGAWGHDSTFPYKPGVYTYETPGVLHQFLNGPTVSEVSFVAYGALEFMDPGSDEVIQSLAPSDLVQAYLEGCESAGLERPKIL